MTPRRVGNNRYEADGLEGLKDRSHRPHHSPRTTQAEVVEKILRPRCTGDLIGLARREFWGVSFGLEAADMLVDLVEVAPGSPRSSAIWIHLACATVMTTFPRACPASR
jgi:hypothetical protein